MKKRLLGIVKLLLVAGLMWFVLSRVQFEDRLVWLGGENGAKEIRSEAVEIVGQWQHDPVSYRLATDPTAQVREAERGTTDTDGNSLDIRPGFLTYWRNLDPLLFGLGALCFCFTVLIAGARWWWLLRVNGTDVTLGETLRFTWIGVFFNTVVPGATGGDLIKALYIMKRCPGHRMQVTVSVVVDRVLGLGSLAVLGAIAVLFALDRYTQVALSIWGVIVGVGLLGVVALSRRLREMVRLKWLLHRLPPKLRHLLQLVDRAIFFYRDHTWVITASLLAGVLNHLVAVGCVLMIGLAIGIPIPAYEYLVLVPVINIVTAIPLAPNGWGIGEMIYGYLFSTYCAVHMPPDTANPAAAMATMGVALSILYRLMLSGFSLIGGLFVLFEKDRVTRDDIDREVALEEREEREERADDAR
ncbi:MAG: flippase-like domain-containing protein [Planctomycetes bacterium]|nr:flippase-like domain-containing protein [Planctomycetota bacterium]